jgi:hypothetical protein
MVVQVRPNSEQAMSAQDSPKAEAQTPFGRQEPDWQIRPFKEQFYPASIKQVASVY